MLEHYEEGITLMHFFLSDAQMKKTKGLNALSLAQSVISASDLYLLMLIVCFTLFSFKKKGHKFIGKLKLFHQIDVLIDYSLNISRTCSEFLQFLVKIIFVCVNSALPKKCFVLHCSGFV